MGYISVPQPPPLHTKKRFLKRYILKGVRTSTEGHLMTSRTGFWLERIVIQHMVLSLGVQGSVGVEGTINSIGFYLTSFRLLLKRDLKVKWFTHVDQRLHKWIWRYAWCIFILFCFKSETYPINFPERHGIVDTTLDPDLKGVGEGNQVTKQNKWVHREERCFNLNFHTYYVFNHVYVVYVIPIWLFMSSFRHQLHRSLPDPWFLCLYLFTHLSSQFSLSFTSLCSPAIPSYSLNFDSLLSIHHSTVLSRDKRLFLGKFYSLLK